MSHFSIKNLHVRVSKQSNIEYYIRAPPPVPLRIETRRQNIWQELLSPDMR